MARQPRTEYQRVQREKAFAAVALARRDGISITAAAKRTHTTVKNVNNWSTALTKQGSRYNVSAFDRAPRRTTYILPAELGGPITVQGTFLDSRTVSNVNAYNGDVGRWLAGADFDTSIGKWRGRSFTIDGRRIRFETNEDVLREWERRGEARDVMVGSG